MNVSAPILTAKPAVLLGWAALPAGIRRYFTASRSEADALRYELRRALPMSNPAGSPGFAVCPLRHERHP